MTTHSEKCHSDQDQEMPVSSEELIYLLYIHSLWEKVNLAKFPCLLLSLVTRSQFWLNFNMTRQLLRNASLNFLFWNFTSSLLCKNVRDKTVLAWSVWNCQYLPFSDQQNRVRIMWFSRLGHEIDKASTWVALWAYLPLEHWTCLKEVLPLWYY